MEHTGAGIAHRDGSRMKAYAFFNFAGDDVEQLPPVQLPQRLVAESELLLSHLERAVPIRWQGSSSHGTDPRLEKRIASIKLRNPNATTLNN